MSPTVFPLPLATAHICGIYSALISKFPTKNVFCAWLGVVSSKYSHKKYIAFSPAAKGSFARIVPSVNSLNELTDVLGSMSLKFVPIIDCNNNCESAAVILVSPFISLIILSSSVISTMPAEIFWI